jgi:hypothetical protein
MTKQGHDDTQSERQR